MVAVGRYPLTSSGINPIKLICTSTSTAPRNTMETIIAIFLIAPSIPTLLLNLCSRIARPMPKILSITTATTTRRTMVLYARVKIILSTASIFLFLLPFSAMLLLLRPVHPPALPALIFSFADCNYLHGWRVPSSFLHSFVVSPL